MLPLHCLESNVRSEAPRQQTEGDRRCLLLSFLSLLLQTLITTKEGRGKLQGNRSPTRSEVNPQPKSLARSQDLKEKFGGSSTTYYSKRTCIAFSSRDYQSCMAAKLNQTAPASSSQGSSYLIIRRK